MVVFPFKATSWVLKPIYDTTNIEFAFVTFKENLPSKSDWAPFFVPFSIIFAPGKGCPLLSVTAPDI